MNSVDDKIGLCRNCQNVRVVKTNRGSVFYLCQLAATDSRFLQYPRLPVLSCQGYTPVADRQVEPQPQN
jgi:hypothetical protein